MTKSISQNDYFKFRLCGLKTEGKTKKVDYLTFQIGDAF